MTSPPDTVHTSVQHHDRTVATAWLAAWACGAAAGAGLTQLFTAWDCAADLAKAAPWPAACAND